jgi:integrase
MPVSGEGGYEPPQTMKNRTESAVMGIPMKAVTVKLDPETIHMFDELQQQFSLLEKQRLRSGVLAQLDLPIFQNGTGTPLHLDNLARRVLAPAFALKKIGWHAFRRGLATNLHTLGVADKDIQAILRHSTLAPTMNIYVKSVNEAQSMALDSLSERMGQTDVIH